MKEPLAYLHSFQSLKFGYSVSQAKGISWLMKALIRSKNDVIDEKTTTALSLYEQLMQSPSIETRVTCLQDYTHHDCEKMMVYKNDFEPNSNWCKPSLEKRMEIFRPLALDLVLKCFEKDVVPPAHLIQISCTGYDSPHATQRLVARKNWGTQTQLLHIGHMGCYAALPASYVAASLLNGTSRVAEGKTASLFFIELCTLHLDPSRLDAEQVVMNTLFADGAIRFDTSLEKRRDGFALLEYAEEILPNCEEEMTWILQNSCFGMTLSRSVPVLLKRNIFGFLDRLLGAHQLTLKDIDFFAIHPGGPKIIEYLSQALALKEEQYQHSLEILRTRGNMSSCTIPHIWEKILQDPSVPNGSKIVSLAFGPGLTIAGNILRKGI